MSENFAEGSHTDETTGEDTATDSHSEDANQEEETQSPDGENNQGDDKTPFHEHPRWKQREDEWNTRFNDQERRHAEDLKSIREEFGQQRKENKEQTKIPAWFGGTQEQWDAYRTDRDGELKAIEDRAIERAKTDFKSEAGAESKAVEEATKFLNSEVAAIEGDKTLNPTGAKIDRAALLKTVLDNELIDSKGRWNYRAGYKLMKGQVTTTEKKPATAEKKKVAAATTSESKGETKAPSFKTSADFKKKRPW